MRVKSGRCLLLFLIFIAACGQSRPDSWICYFGPELSAEKLAAYDLVILEPDQFKTVGQLAAGDRIAYLSVGECGTYRYYWPQVKGRPWVGAENPNWPGDISVDIRSAKWRSLLLDEVIPGIIQKGFNGLFLDTLNEAIIDELEKKPGADGKIAALLDLIRGIRQAYPDLKVISNNGLDVLDRIGPWVDAVLVEDLATLYDFRIKTSRPQSLQTTQWMVERLNRFSRETGKRIYVIDYVSADDTVLIQQSRDLCRANGFSLYLAGIGLDEIYNF